MPPDPPAGTFRTTTGLILACVVALHAGACSSATGPDAGPPAQTLAEFEAQLDRRRSELTIPGMSAIVVVHDVNAFVTGSLGSGP